MAAPLWPTLLRAWAAAPCAAELCAALQLLCPDPGGWMAHILQGKPTDVAPAAQQAFCAKLRAYTGAPDDGSCVCDMRNVCEYATHMVQGGSSAEHESCSWQLLNHT